MFTKNIVLSFTIVSILAGASLTPIAAMDKKPNNAPQQPNTASASSFSSSSSSSSSKAATSLTDDASVFEDIVHVDMSDPEPEDALVKKINSLVKYKSCTTCKKLFCQFMASDNFDRIINDVMLFKNACRTLFNTDSEYNAWLDMAIDNKYDISMRRFLRKLAKNPQIILKEKTQKAPLISEYLISDIFTDGRSGKDLLWYHPYPFYYGESICINGFMEILKSLLNPNFSDDPNLKQNIRLFITVFCIALSYYLDNTMPEFFNGK